MIKFLIAYNADKRIKNNKGELASDLIQADDENRHFVLLLFNAGQISSMLLVMQSLMTIDVSITI